MLVGPESEVFGADFGKIEKVFVLREFRESADPSYPELTPSTFNEVFKAIGVTGENIKIGLGSYVECTLPKLDVVTDALGKVVNFPSIDIGDKKFLGWENEDGVVVNEETLELKLCGEICETIHGNVFG